MQSQLCFVEDDYRDAWLRLSLIPGMGPVKLLRLVERFGSPQAVFTAPRGGISEITNGKTATLIQGAHHNAQIQQQINHTHYWLNESEQHWLLTLHDPRYPTQLTQLNDPPPVLYGIGDPSLLSEPQIAIVGSRRPTAQGRKIARDFACALSKKGLVITSGLAMGVDGAAHEGALMAGQPTVAVLGTGVDCCYPAQHRLLYEQIGQRAVVISEFPLGTKPFAGNFPKRNRIVVGLSVGVLVVEAATQSGSLISARLAMEQGRDVFAIPGSILNTQSSGCHQLIKDGATLATCPDELIADLAPQLRGFIEPQPVVPQERHVSKPTLPSHLSGNQQTVAQAMGFETIGCDDLAATLQMECSALMVTLTELELEGVVQSVPGGFIRVS